MLSNNQLYWGGFLAADGCVDSEGRVRLYLHSKDKRHLEKFQLFTNKPNKVQHTENYPDRCAFEFTDKDMCDYLTAYFNIIPVKSLIYEMPTWMDDREFSHFLRGYFDGDGCICESFSNAASKTATLYATITGSDPAIEYIASRLKTTLGISGPVQRRNKYSTTGNPYSTVKYSTNKSIELLRYLYNNSEEENRLDRKFELFHRIVVKGNRLTR